MDTERRLSPTVASFLLGIYALFKPRAYIKYELSPLGSYESTSVKFYTEIFNAFSRSPAGATALIIALAILALRIIGPKILGERPMVYLSLVSLALTFYIGAVIGLFSRDYDYIYTMKYASKFVMDNEAKFMMYTVTIAEGGRAVLLGLLMLIVAMIVEGYNARKSS